MLVLREGGFRENFTFIRPLIPLQIAKGRKTEEKVLVKTSTSIAFALYSIDQTTPENFSVNFLLGGGGEWKL